MEYLIRNKYKLIADPYNHGRICFEVSLAEKTLLSHLLDDPKFLFYADNIVYFNS